MSLRKKMFTWIIAIAVAFGVGCFVFNYPTLKAGYESLKTDIQTQIDEANEEDTTTPVEDGE